MRSVALAIVCTVALTSSLRGQVATTTSAAPPASLKSLGMVIYPAQKQSPEQQTKDEAACAQWAESQTGITISGGQVNTQAAGQAAKVKALVNMVMNMNTAGLAEGLALGDALGLDLTMLREVFAQTGANSRVLQTDGEDMQNREHSCFFSTAHGECELEETLSVLDAACRVL